MVAEILKSAEFRRALDGIIPFVVGTCDAQAVPNITFMSQLFYIEDQYVAISYQFMNKTWRNLLVNPIFTAFVTNPDTMSMWKLKMEFLEEEREGPVFEEMEMQLLALATPQHITFSLHSALICKVLAIEKVFDGTKS